MDQNEIEAKVKLINDYITVYNKRDIQAIIPLLDDEIEYKNISHGEVMESTCGLVEFSLYMEQSQGLFTNVEQKILNINLSQNSATVDIHVDATMAVGTIDGLKAGQEISYNATLTFSFENGKIAKINEVS